MRRTVVAQESPDRSFAGLLDHLTGYNREGASSPDSKGDFGGNFDADSGVTFRRTSRPDATPAPTPPAARAAAPAMLPIKETRSGRSPALSEAAPLSYEQALRIHGRRLSPATAGAPEHGSAKKRVPIPPPPVAARNAASAKSIPSPATPMAANAANGSPPRPGAALRKEAPVAPASNPPRGREAADSKKARPAGAGNWNAAAFRDRDAQMQPQPAQAKLNPQAAATQAVAAKTAANRQSPRSSEGSLAPSAGSDRRKGVQRSSAQNAGAAKRATSRQTSPSARKASAPSHPVPKPAPNSGQNPNLSWREQPHRGKEPAKTDTAAHLAAASEVETIYAKSPLEILDPLAELNRLNAIQPIQPLDQRRTIVSVRLTEEEFAKLRDRAEETGISVSAYMRSCVVDADQLRAQVKYALSEMRALSAPADPGRFTALATARSDGATAATGRGWFHMVLRPLAFLFSPLFPTRRSA